MLVSGIEDIGSINNLYIPYKIAILLKYILNLSESGSQFYAVLASFNLLLLINCHLSPRSDDTIAYKYTGEVESRERK